MPALSARSSAATRPLLNEHSDPECASPPAPAPAPAPAPVPALAPASALALTRLLSACALLAFGVASAARMFLIAYHFRFYVQLWVTLFCGLAFLVISAASADAALRGARASVALAIEAPAHFTCCSLALFALFIRLEGASYSWVDYVSVHYVLPLALVAADLCMGARVRFRAAYLPLPQLLLLAHTTTLFLKVENFPLWMLGVRHLSLLAASVVVFLLSRMPDLSKFPLGFDTDRDIVSIV